MEPEKLSNAGLNRLHKEGESCGSSTDSPVPELRPSQLPDSPAPALPIPQQVAVVLNSQADAPLPVAGAKRKRGRPPKGEGKAVVAAAPARAKKGMKKEDDDVCFICFDGGSLVLCDQGDCPKAYHPACIKRDEAFFSGTTRWTCGWHICSKCQDSAARYMCYTCTYSLCKRCSKDADFLRVRGNKGFCSTCYPVITMIENIDQGNKETVQVDFDDERNWEYLFKVYWMCLKKDLSLTVDEIIRAQKPSIAPTPSTVTQREISSAAYHLRNNGTTARENSIASNGEISYTSVKSICDNNNNNSVLFTAWASKELLSFVAYMRNGDTSVLSPKEVQALLFNYIKRNNLRDPHQRSEIICDSELESLFKKPRVRHFEMLTLLESHFPPNGESPRDEIGGGVIDPAISNSHNLPIISENCRDTNGKKTEERDDRDRVNEEKCVCGKLESHVESSGSTNNDPNNQTSATSLSNGSTLSANDREAENLWRYRDPNGKVQGPFGMEQFRKWSLTGIFPPEMRIWKLNTEERDSVLLTDVIKCQVTLRNNLSSSPQEAKGTPDSTSHHCDGPWSGGANYAGIVADADSNGKGSPESTFHHCDEPWSGSASSDRVDKGADTNGMLEIVRDDVSVSHSSSLTTLVINKDPQIDNDAQIRMSSKCLDSNAPKVINYVERSSPVTEQPHEEVHRDIGDLAQAWNPTPNYENWKSQVNIVSQPTDRVSHNNQVNEQVYQVNDQRYQVNEQYYQVNEQRCQVNEQTYQVNQQANQVNQQHCFGQPFSEELLRKNNPVNNWNSLEAHPHYASLINSTNPSEQKFNNNLQEFSMPISKTSTGFSEAQTIEEQQMWQPQQFSVQNSSIPNVTTLPPQLTDHNQKNYFQNQKTSGHNNNFEKVRATENTHSLSPNCAAQDSSWSSASSSLVIGGGNQLPRSASSFRPHDVATPTSKLDELLSPSPPNPVPNASSWLAMMTEPLDFHTLGEESVSDLLAEVDAMEPNSEEASPNMLMDYVDDLFDDSKTDWFTSLGGISP